MRPRRIGFLSIHNPHDRMNFSGVPHYMLRALQSRPDIEVVVMGDFPRYLPGLVGRLQKKILKRGGLDLAAVVEPEGVDVILSVVSSRFVAEHAARMRAPVFHITDATPNFLREVYGRDVSAQADVTEADCLKASAQVVYSSDYMARRALSEFPGLRPEHVHAFPFGLNLDDIPDGAPPKPPLEKVNLLLVGTDWERKGGPLAVSTLDVLRARGVDATLAVMGNTEVKKLDHPHIRSLGFIDKNTAEGRGIFARELTRAHLLLHPTRADCSAMVVAEANVYGCPVAVTDVGGIASVMDPGRNGTLFALEDGPDDIADIIMSMTADPEHYQKLFRSSRLHYEHKLTWSKWVDNLLEIVPVAAIRGGS